MVWVAGFGFVRRRALALPALVALAAAASACASSGAVPRPFPGAPVVRRAPSPPALPAPPSLTASPGETLVATALALRGVPYRNGGSGPEGFDCSGFTQYVFAQHGLALPRDTRAQFDVGDKISAEAVEAGDLLFFSTIASGPSHVAIAIGEDAFVHAPSSAGVVRIERRSLPYWSERYLGARRVQAARN
jgi:cell wall-associated NlpC family hydrolase